MPASGGDLFFAPAVDLAAQIRTRDLSPVDLMHATLERIEAVNPRLNAIVSLRPAEHLLALGLPLGAPRLREHLLLQIAHEYEQARPWRDEWPQL